MSHRRLSGRTACGLSKWDAEKAKQIIYSCVDLVVVFVPLVTLSFQMSEDLIWAVSKRTTWRREDVVAGWDGSFRRSEFSLANTSARKLFGIASWIWTERREGAFSILSSTWERENRQSVIVSCERRWEVTSCAMADEWKPGKAKEEDSQTCFICPGVGWCKQTRSLCKLLILWTVKSSRWKQEN